METRLDRVVDMLPGLVWTDLPNGRTDFVSPRWREYTGLHFDETCGPDWQAAVHPDDRPGLLAEWQACVASGDPGELEARLRRFDGEYRWFLFSLSPLTDASGELAGWCGVATDIDDRKRREEASRNEVEEALRRSNAYLAEAQQLSATGSFSWRVESGEIAWSEQVYRMFGYDAAEPVTLEMIGARVHPEDLPLLDDMIERASRGEPGFEFEHRLLLPDGSLKHLHLTAHGAPDWNGGMEYIGAVQEVTERRVSEAALSKVRAELAHMARVTSLGALTASIAHEVNQPLSGIITNANTCLKMLATDPPNVLGAQETARRTVRDGNRAADIIQRLRMLFGKQGSTHEPVDLNEAAREVLALTWTDLQRGRVSVRMELAEDLPRVAGDRVQLQQVILNLLSNAADSMSAIGDRPRLLVVRTARVGSESVRFAVRDSGVGLDAESAERMFEAFYTSKSDGMGIGLSISRSIIENHGGRLWAQPNEGPGMTFAFSIACSCGDVASLSLERSADARALQAPAEPLMSDRPLVCPCLSKPLSEGARLDAVTAALGRQSTVKP